METKYLKENDERLKAVLAVYDSVVNYHHFDNGRIGAGQPLTLDTAKEVFKFLNDIQIVATNYKFKEIFIQKNVLYFSNSSKEILWWTPPMEQMLYFDSKLPIKSGVYPVPTLLWKLVGNTLNVWALEKEPIKSNEYLFHAPFLNINSKGEVCMGNVNFETNSEYYEEIILKTQTAFFNSFFTHTNHDSIINGNYTQVLEEMQSLKEFSNAKFIFPLNLLVKTQLKIKDIISNEK